VVGITSFVSRHVLALSVLVLAVVFGVGLRVAATVPKQALTHDEAISYLAATCHQGEYQSVTFDRAAPYGRWVSAAEWQRFLQPEERGCLGRIAADLARFDIHPPLYFWLLHGWSVVFGVSAWTGALLNAVLAGLGALALYGLAREVLGEELRGATVTFVWAFSPGVLEVFAEARQYELLGLLTILVTWQALRFAAPDGGRRRDVALLAVLAAAGLLTHYHFAIVLAGVAGLLTVRLGRRARARLIAGLGALAAGCVAFGLLHPGFWHAFATQRRQAGGFVAEQFPGRLDQVVEALSGFLLPEGAAATPWRWPVAALLVAVSAWLGATALRATLARGRAPGDGRAGAPDGADERSSEVASAPVLGMLAWTGGVTFGLYLLFISHGLAMTPKYLAAVWPFLAFVPVLAVLRLPARARLPLAGAGGAGLVALASVAALRLNTAGAPPTPGAATTGAEAAVVDNVARGIFPRVVWELAPDTRVFAADQRFLLAHPERWTAPPPGAVLVSELPVSDPRYGNSPEQGRRVVEELRRRHSVEATGESVRGLGRVYTVR
jgi:hypothetical protein